mgnify:CR=1 FL=1
MFEKNQNPKNVPPVHPGPFNLHPGWTLCVPRGQGGGARLPRGF